MIHPLHRVVSLDIRRVVGVDEGDEGQRALRCSRLRGDRVSGVPLCLTRIRRPTESTGFVRVRASPNPETQSELRLFPRSEKFVRVQQHPRPTRPNAKRRNVVRVQESPKPRIGARNKALTKAATGLRSPLYPLKITSGWEGASRRRPKAKVRESACAGAWAAVPNHQASRVAHNAAYGRSG